MVTNYMLTIPRTIPKRAIMVMLEVNDCKKWIVAKETGHGGYEHWQVRLSTSNRDFFALDKKTGQKTGWLARHIPQAHCEECNDDWEYEKKEHKFVCSDDGNEVLKIRFGKLRDTQREMLRTIRTQNDRQVDVWLDPSGNHGKTWFSLYLYEHGIGMVIPRASCTAEKLSAYVCSAYKGEEIIIIDIPRSGKLSAGVYEAIEEIKDGLVFDHRYSGRCRNIRGVRVVVFTNNELDKKKLSHDRWRLHGIKEDGTLT